MPSKNPVQLKSTPPVGANKKQVAELLGQALETEVAGVQVYETAIRSTQNAALKKEWMKHLEQAREHVRILREAFAELGLDDDAESPGRMAVKDLAACLLGSMDTTRQDGSLEAAQLVAAECVVVTATKADLNWTLVGALAKALTGKEGKILQAGFDEAQGTGGAHLNRTTDWARELWLKSLGLAAVLPPQERIAAKESLDAAPARQARAPRINKTR